MSFLADKLRELTHLFRTVSDTPELDAKWLLQDLWDLPETAFIADNDFTPTAQQADLLDQAITRRLAHEPVSRILGQRDFWTLTLDVSPDVLDPRPDTECLVEAVLNTLPDRTAPLSILDLATGSGAILLALLSELPNATGLGTDISDPALTIARKNSVRNGLDDRCQFQKANWFDGVEGRFDIITSNPPYIDHAALTGLPPAVADYDPLLALDGGADGLDAYRAILVDAPTYLTCVGLLGLEIGFDQADQVKSLATNTGLNNIQICSDLGGNDRVLLAFRSG